MEIGAEHIIAIIVGALAAQAMVSLYLLLAFRRANKEQSKIEREMFGLVKKLEGLTANKRENILRHYDQMLEQLETRLPSAVAARASELIFDTESRILNRLAEIDPSLKSNEEGKKKLNELIVTMESLEDTVVTTASDAVRKVILENRQRLSEIDPEIVGH